MLNKKLLRAFYMLVYILLISFIVSGLSNLYGYLNTGADRSRLMLAEVKETDQYIPGMKWDTMQNVGRYLDKESLSAIQEDFVDALYTKHVAYKLNTKRGVDTYFTKSSKKNIYEIIDYNKKNNVRTDETTLTHNIDVHLFSEDGILIAFKDKDVHEYKRIYQNDSLVLETEELVDYEFVMMLEDGFWRIRHMVKQNAKDFHFEPPTHNAKLDIKGINYYPKEHPWNMYGANFDKDAINTDFKILANAGLNTLRVFVPYNTFGRANVYEEILDQLVEMMDIAQKHNLKVIVTLFDFYGNYDVYDWTLNQRHVEIIAGKLKEHPALLAWDIKNEPDLDMPTRGTKTVTAWLKNMIRFIKMIDPNTPVTIGWSNAEAAKILKDQVDFVSFHFYIDLNLFEETYLKLKKEVGDKQVVVGEFGLSSYDGFWYLNGNDENDQANYHKTIQEYFKKYDLGFASWTMYDFKEVPNAVLGWKPWLKNLQKRYGFIDEKGNKKPAFKYIVN